jgi:hypothetical protein
VDERRGKGLWEFSGPVCDLPYKRSWAEVVISPFSAQNGDAPILVGLSSFFLRASHSVADGEKGIWHEH